MNTATAGSPKLDVAGDGALLKIAPQISVWRAFTSGGHGGNPAGIVFPANGMDAKQRQALATELAFSETAFVDTASVVNSKPSFGIEFYTPVRQIAMCGHALSAVGAHLASLGMVSGDYDVSSLRTFGSGGIRPFGRAAENGYVGGFTINGYFDDSSNVFDPTERENVAAMIGATADVLGDLRVLSLGQRGGVPFLFVELQRSVLINELNPEQEEIRKFSERLGLIGLYVYAHEPSEGKVSATARMFAPAVGIAEESATGMAGGALAIHLASRDMKNLTVDEVPFIITQGNSVRGLTGLLQGSVFFDRLSSLNRPGETSGVRIVAECKSDDTREVARSRQSESRFM